MTDGRVEVNEDVVLAVAFGRINVVQRDALYSDDNIVALWEQAKVLAAKVSGQLAEARSRQIGGESSDPDWFRRVRTVNARVQGLLTRLGPMVRDRNRRVSEDRYKAKWRQVRTAVERHRATVRQEYEATVADLALWAVLDAADEL